MGIAPSLSCPFWSPYPCWSQTPSQDSIDMFVPAPQADFQESMDLSLSPHDEDRQTSNVNEGGSNSKRKKVSDVFHASYCKIKRWRNHMKSQKHHPLSNTQRQDGLRNDTISFARPTTTANVPQAEREHNEHPSAQSADTLPATLFPKPNPDPQIDKDRSASAFSSRLAEESGVDEGRMTRDVTTASASASLGSEHLYGDGYFSGSDESSSQSLESESKLEMLHMKHKILVRVMQDFYPIFDQRWTAKFQIQAGETSSTGCVPNQEISEGTNSRGRKRQRENRDQTPPDDGSKRSGNNQKPPPTPEESRLFACPLHKHNPKEYCCSIANGSKYRACGGPGFTSISRLK